MKRNYLKIILPTILSILLFILTIFLIIIPRFQQNIMNGKREMIEELTNSAWSILSKYENDEREGLMTREEAQQTAISRIRYLRYGDENKDYFWITDMTPVMVMHPFRSDLDGKDLSDFTDPHGKRLFVEMVETVRKSEHGFVDYMWQWKDDSLKIVPKLSYVKIFKPWNWVIGTGVYIEDVKEEIAALTHRMILISVSISFVIALLLLYIIKQSVSIEQKRIKAENELHESKEKYRTLVEAATEGLLMVIDGRISFSNKIISNITGYTPEELHDQSLTEILSKSNNVHITDTLLKKTIKDGQYELNLKNKSGDLVNVLVTSSSTDFYGKTVNILIVKDISIDKDLTTKSLDFQKLISTLDVGFFKASLTSKGKIIFANETAVKILGYNNIDELSKSNLLELLAGTDERKQLRKNLLENGYLKNKVLKIVTNSGNHTIISLSLVLLNNGNSEDMICDGIIEDITLQEKERIQTESIIAQLKANDFKLEEPVSKFMAPVTTIDSDSTLGEIIAILSRKKTDCLLLTKNKKDNIGIITGTDIQQRILALNLNLDNPAYMIMSSPVIYLTEDANLIDALSLCESEKINHPVIKSRSGAISGILNVADVYKLLANSSSFLISSIKKAESDDQLKICHSNLQMLLKPMIKSGISISYITDVTTPVSDAIIQRLIGLSICELGPPPAKFSFICLGSEGRKEETLFTDQDNAIIYEDVSKEREKAVNEYFLKLGEHVCNSLNNVGYSFCKGNIMARNSQWCKPYSTWVKYFTGWIAEPEPQNILDASIFFDFRSVYGDHEISRQLKKRISDSINDSPLFLYHLAYNTFNVKPQHISSSGLLSDRAADMIDLKSAITPIIMFARTYSLKYSVQDSNTIERLKSLKANNVLSGSLIDEILFSYNFLMKLRFRNQVDLADDKMPLSNTMYTKNLVEMELLLLKKVLSSIPDYQNQIKNDFRVAT